jgi:hypothetical protein
MSTPGRGPSGTKVLGAVDPFAAPWQMGGGFRNVQTIAAARID